MISQSYIMIATTNKMKQFTICGGRKRRNAKTLLIYIPLRYESYEGNSAASFQQEAYAHVFEDTHQISGLAIIQPHNAIIER